MRFGIYIHFPWCRKRCPYCDFAIAVTKDEPPHEQYLDAVLRELDVRAHSFAGKRLVSIYFGGGTPSIWDHSCLATLITALKDRFDAQDALEISLECNPIDCTPAAFSRWQDAGINRLLVGVQATNDKDLVVLGRDHSMGDGLLGLKSAVSGGFRSVGADVILGVPGSQKPLKSLFEITQLSPPHISAYELTIEERTSFAGQVRRGEVIPEDEDALADLYLSAHEALAALGYEHYEVSSYAKPGHRAVHNSLYWQGADYLGLGNGAASLQLVSGGRAIRQQNKRSVRDYLQCDPQQHVDFREEILADEFTTETLWLAMRTVDGAHEDRFLGRASVVEGLLQDGLVEQKDGFIRPTLKGFLFNNQLIRRLGIESSD